MPRTLRTVSLASVLAAALALGGAGVAVAEDAHHREGGAPAGGGADEARSDEAWEAMGAGDAEGGEGSAMMMMKCEPMMSRMAAKEGRGMMQGGMMEGRGGGQGMMMGMGMQGGMMGHGMKEGGKGAMAERMHGKAHPGPHRLLSADEVTKRLEAMIAGHKRLKVANVQPGGDFSFAAEITTVDGSLVHRLLVDRRDGMVWDAE